MVCKVYVKRRVDETFAENGILKRFIGKVMMAKLTHSTVTGIPSSKEFVGGGWVVYRGFNACTSHGAVNL